MITEIFFLHIFQVWHQEETLRKHKGGRGARRTSQLGSSSVSDTEKILMQLRLDAKAFEEDIKSMGFDVENCVAVQVY